MALRLDVRIRISKKISAYGPLLTLCGCGYNVKESVVFDDSGVGGIEIDGIQYNNGVSISRFIAGSSEKAADLLGASEMERLLIDSWVIAVEQIFEYGSSDSKLLDSARQCLEKSSTLCLNRLTLADLMIYTLVTISPLRKSKSFSNLFNRIRQDPCFSQAHEIAAVFEGAFKEKIGIGTSANESSVKSKSNPIKDEGKFLELESAERGKLVVRFPPEASGYLHIGHAKAALLNQYYQQAFEGQLIMRFDDTNPAKENAHFEKVIKEDLELLQVIPDRWTYSSDHFLTMLEYCNQLLLEGKAYVDDTDLETMRKEREERKESKNRANSVEKNMMLWEEMKKGTLKGRECCVRVKLDMSSCNGALRDPTIYRCKMEEHIRTGSTHKVYPTYDFACPVVDSIEGVTHALRTTEYTDRDEQYYFICDALGIRKPRVLSYARLNMTHTVMSKRKLTWLVDEHHVDGWDDPRLPTIRGIIRRGLTIEGLKQFICAQGGSRSVVTMNWDKLWSFNKKIIDPIAPRYTALCIDDHRLVRVHVTDGFADHANDVPLHPKDVDVGYKVVWYSKAICIEMTDAKEMSVGDTVTFINWGNLKIVEIGRDRGGIIDLVTAKLDLDNRDYKKTLKVTWIAQTPQVALIPVKAAEYDSLISKAIIGKDEDWKKFVNRDSIHYSNFMGEPALKNVKRGAIIQIQRKGFYICDNEYTECSSFSNVVVPLVLIAIPDGSVSPPRRVESDDKGTAGSTISGDSNSLKKPIDIRTLYSQVESQANLLRSLKEDKAEAQKVKAEVAKLLELKRIFKESTGSDYVSGKPPEAKQFDVSLSEHLQMKIRSQGDLIRDLKSKDKKSSETKEAIAKLLQLKERYKKETGMEYVVTNKGKELMSEAGKSIYSNEPSLCADIYSQVESQGNFIRSLKVEKADSAKIKTEVAKLLELKKVYKQRTGNDYVPRV